MQRSLAEAIQVHTREVLKVGPHFLVLSLQQKPKLNTCAGIQASEVLDIKAKSAGCGAVTIL